MTVPIDFGDKEFDYGVGYPTPFSLPSTTVCRVFQIPADENNGTWLALVMGLMMTLSQEENWVQFEGAISREEAAAAWQQMIDCAYEDAPFGCRTTVDTPYWDDDEDVDDSATPEDQPWYGTVSDPEAPPEELDFVENVIVWFFTGLIALATWEIGAAPAILFHTIAPKFIIAQKRGDFGEVIRILVDGKEQARIDTTPYAPGEVIETPIIADPSIDVHDLMIVQVS